MCPDTGQNPRLSGTFGSPPVVVELQDANAHRCHHRFKAGPHVQLPISTGPFPLRHQWSRDATTLLITCPAGPSRNPLSLFRTTLGRPCPVSRLGFPRIIWCRFAQLTRPLNRYVRLWCRLRRSAFRTRLRARRWIRASTQFLEFARRIAFALTRRFALTRSSP